MKALLVAATVAATIFTVTPTAGAATDPTFDNITWGSNSLTASGLTMTLQTMTVHVTDPRQTPSGCWAFIETRTGGTGTLPLSWNVGRLVAGTNADGMWATSFYLPSTGDGTWSLATAQDCADMIEAETPISGSPTFTLTGHHQPRVTFAYVASPVRMAYPYVTVKGRVYDADTGAGIANVRIGRAEDASCINDRDYVIGLNPVTTTNSNGYYAIATSRDDPRNDQCVGVSGTPNNNPDGYPTFVWFRHVALPYLPAVSAHPAYASVRAGSLDKVNGSVLGYLQSCRVLLQRLHGSTAWRTVNSAYIDEGRFTLTAQPPLVGRNIYRVYDPVCMEPNQLPASTSPFTITGS